jgi:DNA-binding response OmpR family regulator
MVPEKDQPIRVLLLEDNEEDVVLVRESLRDAGQPAFVVEPVARLSEGLAQIAAEPFDVVLLDLTLPDSAGIATFKELHARAGDLPVVILSGDSDDAVAMEALELGAQDYLIKGRGPSELLGRTLRYAITR